MSRCERARRMAERRVCPDCGHLYRRDSDTVRWHKRCVWCQTRREAARARKARKSA